MNIGVLVTHHPRPATLRISADAVAARDFDGIEDRAVAGRPIGSLAEELDEALGFDS